MKWTIAGMTLFALSLVLLGCDDRGPAESVSVTRPEVEGLAEITTRIPIDIGELHNDAMERMKARHRSPIGMSADEYVLQLHRNFNKALAQYGPSREVTLEECKQVINLLMVEVQPYFDMFLQDSTKLDPQVLLNHWRESGDITGEEQAQFTTMLRGQPVQPVSKLVEDGLNLHTATSKFWYGRKRGPWMSGPCDCPDKGALKAAVDLLGTIVGGWGGSGLGGALVGYVASNFVDLTSNPSWLGGGAGANGDLITGYGRGPVY